MSWKETDRHEEEGILFSVHMEDSDGLHCNSSNKLFATLKKDGCVELNAIKEPRYFHVHLCSLNDFINQLLHLKAEAEKLWGGDWDDKQLNRILK